MKKTILVLVLLAAAAATAASIKVWSSGDLLSSSDLNANFAHIHNTMVGGHGGRLVNSDVSPSAAIAHSKLANPILLPKAVANVDYCTASPCTVADAKYNVSGVTRSAAGTYVVTFSSARPNTGYTSMVSARYDQNVHCVVVSWTVSAVTVACINGATGNDTDSAFTFLMFDDND
jgi:hypothetical protein